MRALRLLAAALVIGLALAAEAAAYRWDEPGRWLPDLAVGLTFLACGALGLRESRARGTAALLTATGVTWFLGNLSSDLLYLHRGPLVHLILAYPGWRPASRLTVAAIAAGYVTALGTGAWGDEPATIALAAGLVGVARLRSGPVAFRAALLVSTVLAGGSLARLAFPATATDDIALLAYEAALVAVAIGLSARARGPAVTEVADLVVELGEARSGLLRDRLARALADPTVQLGYWSPGAGAYLDGAGAPLPLPGPGATRACTLVERDGRPFAALVHDAAVLRDPALVEAVASATRLSASNAALRIEVQAQAAELMASRRRLLIAADEERRRLEERLRRGPEQALRTLAEQLGRTTGDDAVRLAGVRRQLDDARDDLHELARGLHPRELASAGLPGALPALAARAPVPVALDVTVGRLPAELEVAVWFVCSEALANVAKYASASRAVVAVSASRDRVTVVVSDDGVGGADTACGTGLRGLSDRVEALGGRLTLTSPRGEGTRLAAELPLGGEGR